MKKEIEFAIFDIDGCLSDDQWRFENVDHSIEDKFFRFAAYNEASHGDEPANESTFHHQNSLREILIITARPEEFREKTTNWLAENFNFLATKKNLLMRPNGNEDTSPEIKGFLLDSWLRSREDSLSRTAEIVIAFDGRGDVLSMYEDRGITTVLLQVGDYQRSRD